MATAYALLVDLTNYGVGTSAAFGSLSSAQQQKALDAANALADSYLGARFKLPLSSFGEDLKEAVVAIARFKLLTMRGFNPDPATGSAIVESKKDAIAWFEGIADGTVNPVVVDASSGGLVGGEFVETGTPDPNGDGTTFVVSKPSARGW